MDTRLSFIFSQNPSLDIKNRDLLIEVACPGAFKRSLPNLGTPDCIYRLEFGDELLDYKNNENHRLCCAKCWNKPYIDLNSNQVSGDE